METMTDQEGVRWMYSIDEQLWYAKGRRPLTHNELLDRLENDE